MKPIVLKHPKIRRATICHEGPVEGSWRMIIVIEVDMTLNPQDDDFDYDALNTIREAAMAYVNAENRQVEDFRIVQAV